MNNRNTTVAGIGAILVAVGSILTNLFDGDVSTVPDYAAAVAAVLAGVTAWLVMRILDAKFPEPAAEQHGAAHA